MPDPHNSRNAAWQAANRWRARAAQTRPDSLASSIKLFFTWLLFGAMMIIALVLGLVLLLIGWAMMPFLRHRMKKRMEAARAHQATDIGGGNARREPPGPHETLEGHYSIRDDEPRER
ncbi:hypothetical protein [Vreelandella jeotgali]|uniref:hypothetical protein n=1 Tax=Vreelandella jeotgali TaxID=553386 RepID=UPI00034AFBF8|nr:hypothetical protein [Halomonas jeotgali]